MMELNETQLTELKSVELDMLKRFVAVCDALGLRYYILYGTLLGAVRHKGFIPWDDDIDVGMPREDYEKFIYCGQQYFPEGYFIQTHMTDPEYPANFAKIRNSNTTYVESSVVKCRMNHGVYIDIFPLDYYPQKNVRLFKLKKLLLTLRISTVFTNLKPKFKTKVLMAGSCLLYPSWKSAINKRDELFKSVLPGERMVSYGGAWGKREIMPAEWFGEGTALIFEGLEVKGPSEYDKWLTNVYGDYMQLPPEEKRIGHHYVDVFDLKKPYTHYVK